MPERFELRQLSRNIGALLLVFGGLALILQSFWADVLPPPDGFMEVQAVVMNKEQRGTFQDPLFSVTLAYDIESTNGAMEELRSGRRVPLEVYYALSEGQLVTTYYNPSDTFEWRLNLDLTDNSLEDYALGIIMMVFGGFSLIFPTIVRWASREEDFQYTEELPA